MVYKINLWILKIHRVLKGKLQQFRINPILANVARQQRVSELFVNIFFNKIGFALLENIVFFAKTIDYDACNSYRLNKF